MQVSHSRLFPNKLCHHFFIVYHDKRASLVAQTVKNLPAMQETQVQILGQEDPLEKG